ncbi:MAG TPA: DEAD/DEAH box helicase [Candidatus Gastranaerophilaceae bacterium]|mgnify:CR=1 FL=1|nr:DEAD/DEAH box helicase [Candidatus Gastranaerophilaceae bacterium]HPT40948.1 DEAD/DEAH box helicase [Candidatus Gastranaerophilaceae bacterium]
MQILKISFTGERRNNRIPYQRTAGNTPPIKLPNQKHSDTFVKGDSYNFSTEPQFYETLEENYFKLPRGCYPDEYQKKAAAKLYKGEDVLVTAPTGTGKTAIAYYVITKNLSEGKKTFYTTPLKALSNQKYRELQTLYGKDNVGLLTGDIKINADAPIIVMTTEIYRNMLFSKKFQDNPDNLLKLKTVVFDELHYLGDVDRGGIWEQSIILTDKNVQLLSLSATIGNNNQINNWMSDVKGKKSNLIDVPPEKRHVPLVFETHNLTGENVEGRKLKKHQHQKSKDANDVKKAYIKFISELKGKDRLPAILFIFSRKFSKKLLDEFDKSTLQLTSRKEKEEIQKIIDQYTKNGKYLGETLNTNALLKGYALHNAGLLPTQKELVEELFQKKLVKLVIATETLSAGINMPAKTVIISDTRKPTSAQSADGDDGKREITANEFHQMAGRAGRRGIDKIGYVYTTPKDKEEKEIFNILIDESPNSLESAFNPDFSFVAGYCKHYQDDELIKTILKKSLHSYDTNPKASEKKYLSMFKLFENKREMLKHLDYITSDNKLTTKGQLLAKINGYQQLPIIDLIYDKKLATLNPIELAAVVGSLANLSQKDDYNKETEFFGHKNDKISWFVDDFDSYLDKFNTLNKNSEVAQDKDAVKHLYEWAELNSKFSGSRRNWKGLYCGVLHKTIRDEGSLFKEITQTVDLLKQMRNISKKGYQLAELENNKNDMEYYKQLSGTIGESLKLLLREPITEII